MARKATSKKNKGGRPKLFKEEYIEQVEKLCRLGSTDKDIADFFNVTETTINNWKNDNNEFFESIKRGKDSFDTDRVEGALKHRALGMILTEEKQTTRKLNMDGAESESEVIDTTITKKEIAPDTGAAAFWLKNRDPKRWREKQEIDHTTKGESFNDISKLPTSELLDRAKAAKDISEAAKKETE